MLRCLADLRDLRGYYREDVVFWVTAGEQLGNAVIMV